MRSYTYQITPEKVTEMAQDIHNDIDQNGEISCDGIVEVIVDELVNGLKAWVEENIDWAEIAYQDLDAKEDSREYLSTQLYGWR